MARRIRQVRVVYGGVFRAVLLLYAHHEGGAPYYFDWIAEYIYYLWAALGVVVFFVYDAFMTVVQRATNYYLKKIVK